MSDYYKIGKPKPVRKPLGDKNSIYFDGWALHKRGSEFFLTYISSAHGGDEKKIQISEEEYESAKLGNIGLSEIIQKLREKDF